MRLKRKFQKRDAINLAAIAVFIGMLAWLTVQYAKTFGELKGGDLVVMAERFREMILKYGGAGLWVITLLHAFQVVVAAIPASVVQFAGAMIYGLWPGMMIGILGVAAGSLITFYASRLLGRGVVTLFVSEKNLEKLEKVISSDMSTLLLLFLFIIPFPKDFIAYFVGLTRFKAPKFFLISFLGRLPGMFVASYLGTHIFDRNYFLLVTVSIISGLSFLLVFLCKDRIIGWMSRRGKEEEE